MHLFTSRCNLTDSEQERKSKASKLCHVLTDVILCEGVTAYLVDAVHLFCLESQFLVCLLRRRYAGPIALFLFS